MEAVDFLRSTTAIRQRCNHILNAVLQGQSHFFEIDLVKLSAAAERVAKLTQQRFPDGKIPYHARWRHFEAGGIDRLHTLPACDDLRERARREIDLAVTAVLLDAGSGPHWSYSEAGTGWCGGRSEGLGVAAFHTFASGLFGGSPLAPMANAASLCRVVSENISNAFQVSVTNPLVGLEGRTALLVRLASALRASPHFFGGEARPGGMFDALVKPSIDLKSSQATVNAADILNIVIVGLGPIWLTDNRLNGQALGDCWQHRLAGGEGESSGWVPFHKLSQWMTYSLLEPFERAGVKVIGLDALTGLPEYRNGGLLIDCGVIKPKVANLFDKAYKVGDELIIEWRALTVALLDQLANEVRQQMGLSVEQLPLACVLEGGTWAAGRMTAQELRQGLPPIEVISDGTVF
jgi:Protein of unknown function (DUF1688)